RRLARLGDRVDALQLELALPLRLPGRWRDAFVAACAQGFDGATAHTTDLAAIDRAAPAARVALEFVAPGLSGLAALDEHGGRLLLFADDGALCTFTGERVGSHAADGVAGLRLATDGAGGVALAYTGP